MTIADQLAEIRKRTDDELQHFPDLKRAEGNYPIFDCCTLLRIIDADRAAILAALEAPCICRARKAYAPECHKLILRKRLAE